MKQRGVAAAGHEADARIADCVTVGEPAGVEVSGNVVVANDRTTERGGDPLGRCEPDQQRTHESGRDGDRHRLDPVKADAGPANSLVDHRQNSLQVSPGRQFRHHPPPPGVEFFLARDHARQHRPIACDHRRRRLVTGRLNGQKRHVASVAIARSWPRSGARNRPLGRRPAEWRPGTVSQARAGRETASKVVPHPDPGAILIVEG